MPSTEQQSLFVEQAEYLEPDRFAQWSAEHPDEESIIRRLTQTGAKLLTGPRGSGKTTLLLKAYYRLLDTKGAAFPIYVNFKSSLKLEPLYRNNANAVYWFKQWLLLKVYQGLLRAIIDAGATAPADLRFTKTEIDHWTGQLELGQTELTESDVPALNLSVLEEEVSKVLRAVGRSRAVLFLDDAAHAFSPEQQRDFFDFFRQVKSRTIAPKAAIYPGVTIYSATFHVGHDAEEIDVWLRPDRPGYVEFMSGLLVRRLPGQVYQAISAEPALLHLLCYAAFGMPRALLNMVRSFYSEGDDPDAVPSVRFNRTTALQAVKVVYDNSMGLYSSLALKLPMYAGFVETGEVVYGRVLEAVKAYNREKAMDRQSVTLAMQRPVPAEIAKVLGFFQYAGLLLPNREVSRGEKGVFELFTIHYAALIDRNVLFGRRAVKAADLVEALKSRNAHEFTRVSVTSMLGGKTIEAAFPLSLPACEVCRTPRVNEQARFCMNCGAQLKSVSVFESLVQRDISELPLTATRVTRIKQSSSIRKIKDILMDHENRELRRVPRIGPYWAKRIYAYAEEYIA
jgi:RecA/RadA recombinase